MRVANLYFVRNSSQVIGGRGSLNLMMNNFNVGKGNMAYPLNMNFPQQQNKLNPNGTISIQLPVYAVACENNMVSEYYLFDDASVVRINSVYNSRTTVFPYTDTFQRIWNLPLMNDEIHCIDIKTQTVHPLFLAGQTVKQVLCAFFKARYGNMFNFANPPAPRTVRTQPLRTSPFNLGIDYGSIEDEVMREEKEREKFNESKQFEIQYIIQAMLENPFQIRKSKNALRIDRKFMKEAFLNKKEIKIDTESDEDYIIVHL